MMIPVARGPGIAPAIVPDEAKSPSIDSIPILSMKHAAWETMSCTCGRVRVMGAPCRHWIAVADAAYLNDVVLEHFHPRWHRSRVLLEQNIVPSIEAREFVNGTPRPAPMVPAGEGARYA